MGLLYNAHTDQMYFNCFFISYFYRDHPVGTTHYKIKNIKNDLKARPLNITTFFLFMTETYATKRVFKESRQISKVNLVVDFKPQ